MAPHCVGSLAPVGLRITERQTTIEVPLHAGAGAESEHAAVTVGGLELVGMAAGSRCEACSTALMAVATAVLLFCAFPQVPQVGRAATIAPCCAACVIVE